MNESIRIAGRALALVALSVCLSFAPAARAVSPPPDGGYAGSNTAEGTQALFNLTTGVWNTALGFQALFNDTTGGSNTATGLRALFNNNGSSNVAYGVYALFNITTGSNNIGVGNFAGNVLTTESNVIVIGSHGEAGEENYIRIGTEGVHEETYIAGITGMPVVGNPVCVDDEGELGECSPSSERFKHDIESMDRASEAIFAMRPVTFRYNPQFHSNGALEFGLVAEEVAKIDPTLVKYNKKGEIYGVRYDAINTMLLNEFIKEHQTVQDLKATIAAQEKTLNAFAASLKEQQAQIQKVSAQVTASKPAPQVVSNR